VVENCEPVRHCLSVFVGLARALRAAHTELE
jgi:hypothetical protein